MVRWTVSWTRVAALGAGLGVALACGGEGETSPVESGVAVVDDAGAEIRLDRPAARVVSLVPSVTETVVALGAADRLVARTRFDADPALGHLPDVGGGLDPSLERIVALAPDLVFAWDAADDRALRPRLAAAGIPVYSAAVEDTAAIFATIARVGALLGAGPAADSVAGALRDSLGRIAAEATGPRPTVLYLIAGDPPRTAGAASFIGQAIAIAGGRAAFPELDEPWPAVSLEAVLERSPDVVVLPVGHGLPARAAVAAQPGWRDLPAVRAGRIVEIDADLLARPGPRLGAAVRALRTGLAGVAEPAGAGRAP